jgi:catechol 2,3-dioxygenase-like lactoylglutathione lyase family enzyme
MRYVHTNLVARDWRRLADFYVNVFRCTVAGDERDLHGDWLDVATGLSGARLRGIHLRLPGCGADGPTLEVFSYDDLVDADSPVANRVGFGHIAFLVEDVEATLAEMVAAGGSRLGDVAGADTAAGRLTVVYARDPEGNIVELQRWHSD